MQAKAWQSQNEAVLSYHESAPCIVSKNTKEDKDKSMVCLLHVWHRCIEVGKKACLAGIKWCQTVKKSILYIALSIAMAEGNHLY